VRATPALSDALLRPRALLFVRPRATPPIISPPRALLAAAIFLTPARALLLVRATFRVLP
jgi:hypothetical protein